MSGIFEMLRGWLLETLYLLPGLVIGFTVHEFCHALAAVKLGDATPKTEGRLTLNPGAHIDWMGMITYLLLGWGYARPVRIRPSNLKGGKLGEAAVALAGPLANLVLAFVFYTLYSFLPKGLWQEFAFSAFLVNATLFGLNLLPIAPLDGFAVLRLLLPLKASKFIFWMQRYGFMVLLALSLFNVLDLYLYVVQSVLTVAIGAVLICFGLLGVLIS